MSQPAHDTANDFARNLTDLVKRLRGANERRSAVGGTTTGGANPDEAIPDSFRNPMDAAGELIRGGTAGAPVAVSAGTDGDVLTMVAGLPAWAAASGGPGPGERYRQYIFALDGTDWGFVSVEVGGQRYPVTALYALE